MTRKIGARQGNRQARERRQPNSAKRRAQHERRNGERGRRRQRQALHVLRRRGVLRGTAHIACNATAKSAEPRQKKRAASARAGGALPELTSSEAALDGFLEILRDAEGNLLRRLDLDRLAGCRAVAAHARRTDGFAA